MIKNDKGLIAGSFDPPTLGHTHMIFEAALLVNELYIVIATNPSKKALLTVEERVKLLEEYIEDVYHAGSHIKIVVLPPDETVAQFAKDHNIYLIFRGLRNTVDFEYEHQLYIINNELNKSLITLFIMAPKELLEISSSMIKAMLPLKGTKDLIKKYLPPNVFKYLTRDI